MTAPGGRAGALATGCQVRRSAAKGMSSSNVMGIRQRNPDGGSCLGVWGNRGLADRAMKPRREAKGSRKQESEASEVSRPVVVAVPDGDVAFAESVHAQDFAMSPRVDAFHKLVYVLRGRVRYEEEGRTAEAAEVGAVIVVPQRRRHVLVDEVASTLLLLGVSDGFLAADEDVAEMWRALAARARRVVRAGAARVTLENLWRRALVERAQARA